MREGLGIITLAFEMRQCWNRQTGTIEGRVSLTYGFKSHLPHQENGNLRKRISVFLYPEKAELFRTACLFLRYYYPGPFPTSFTKIRLVGKNIFVLRVVCFVEFVPTFKTKFSHLNHLLQSISNMHCKCNAYFNRNLAHTYGNTNVLRGRAYG